MRRPFVLSGVVLALGAGASSARRADEPPPAVDPGLVERVTVRLVQFNFLAIDDDGRPVPDLRPDEVELRVDGERRDLAFLQPYDSPSATPSAAIDSGGAATPAGADSKERTPSDGADTGRWIVLVFDHANASIRTRTRSHEAAREYVATRVRAKDRIAVAQFDSRLRIVQNFTGNVARLQAAIDEVGRSAPRASRDQARAMDQLLDELRHCRERGPAGDSGDAAERCASMAATSYEDDRSRELDAFASALRWLLYASASIPEVKTVIVFSEGVSRVPSRDASDAVDAVLGLRGMRTLGVRSREEAEERFDAVAEAAALAKASIFTINPGGSSRMTSSSASRTSPAPGGSNALGIDPWRSSERNAQQSLHEISWRTGGTAAQASDILRELQRIDALAPARYTIGYYARPEESAGTPRTLKIKILRKDVRAEFQRDTPPPPTDRPPLAGELRLEPSPCGEDGRRTVTLSLRIDRSSLSFTRLAGKASANFAMLLRLTPAIPAAPSMDDFRTLNITTPVREHDAGGQADPVVEQRLVLPCAAYSVSVTVTDAGSGSRREFLAQLAE